MRGLGKVKSEEGLRILVGESWSWKVFYKERKELYVSGRVFVHVTVHESEHVNFSISTPNKLFYGLKIVWLKFGCVTPRSYVVVPE